MIKKILLFSFVIIFIPVIIVICLIRTNEKEFLFNNNEIIRVYRQDSGVIDSVPLEEYILGVLAGEMPVEYNLEALKAQAVASRSYVLVQMMRNKEKDYDVVDTVMNQVYLDSSTLKSVWSNNYQENTDKIKEAVLSTKGEYISYNNTPAEALFFSTSPGFTENSEEVFSNKVEYLRSVDSHWDESSAVYKTEVKYSKKEFFDLLNLEYSDDIKIDIIDVTSTGRIKSLNINDKFFKASEVCSLLSLKSTYFKITIDSDTVIISNMGYGHGVGMSQYGANEMAKEGYSYKDILNHYYTNIEIKKL